MRLVYHTNITLGALRRWLIAQFYDSLLVGALWLAALLWLHVPLAFVWAMLAAGLQWIPQFGLLLALLGPSMALLFSGAHLDRWLGLLAAYAVIAALDGFVLQPYLMRRMNRVPVWASLLTPIMLGIVLPFWGVLLAPPILAIIYTYRGGPRKPPDEDGRPQQFSSDSEGVVLPPEKPSDESERR